MRRLHHSYAGHLRSMQMSATQLFVFVEGKQCDPFFFAEICKQTINRSITYEISTAQEISGNTGGKQAMIGFFTFLRKRRSLITDLKGLKTACIFFVDKDIDDLQRIKKRSPHFVYTQHYDVQNYVFQHGDLVRGSAAAASVDSRRLQAKLGDASQWCRHVSNFWRDWIALCLWLIEDGIPCEANYRVLSRVQTHPCGPTDPTALDSFIHGIARRINLPVAELRRKLRKSTDKVNRYFARGEHHRIFKGKWFASILADNIEHIMAGNPYDDNGLDSRLPTVIAGTLDFSESWTDYFKKSLEDVVAMI